MDREYMCAADYCRCDADFSGFTGSVELAFDYLALCENGYMYRDIHRLCEHEAHYEELCA